MKNFFRSLEHVSVKAHWQSVCVPHGTKDESENEIFMLQLISIFPLFQIL